MTRLVLEPRQLAPVLRLVTLLASVSAAAVGRAADWPAYRHDQGRSGVTSERLAVDRIGPAWVHRAAAAPSPAWAGAAKWDAYHSKKDLTPMRDYDLAYQPIVVDGRLFYASSADDGVHCLDAVTGERRWTFSADGPVRIAPTWVDGRLYFGSDDGYAYCVDATTGRLVWRFSPTAGRRMVLNNGRLISTWPVRTGVVVSGETAYFAASLLPWKESYLCAVDAGSGKPESAGRYVRLINAEEGRTFEAAMATDGKRLLTPQGRLWLLAYDLADGRRNEEIPVAGAGSFVMLAADGIQAGGGGARSAGVPVVDPRGGSKIVTHAEALSMVIDGGTSIVQTAAAVEAVDRASSKRLWKTDCGPVFSVIMAGDIVLAGCRDAVLALSRATGETLWRAEVDGDAHALAVAGKALFVGTHTGSLHCFREGAAAAPAAEEPVVEPRTLPEARLAAGPLVRFTAADAAEVRWTTPAACRTVIEYRPAAAVPGAAAGRIRTIQEDTAATEHEATLTGLRRGRDYEYRIVCDVDGGATATPWYVCENLFNFEVDAVRPDPRPDSSPTARRLATAVDHVLAQADTGSGICLVYGLENGRLAEAIAAAGRMRVVCVDEDAARVEAVRKRLREAGSYGERITAVAVPALAALPFPDAFANLVVSERSLVAGSPPGAVGEALRVLRPCGGLLLVGGGGDDQSRKAVEAWARDAGNAVTVVRDDSGTWCRGVRGRLPGSGDWTHQYGTAANQGFCGETLRGATAIDDLELQWIGNPGPRYQPDRQVRKPAPLAANGRLYMQGLDRIIAADAYNGTILWSLEVPGLRRFNLPRDASNMCADDDHLYVAAGDACWKISGADGRLVATFPVVRPPNHSWDLDWGYVAVQDGILFGSATKRGSHFSGIWGNGNWFDSKGGWDTAKACSDNLFALDAATGRPLWSHAGGVVIHSGIALGPDTVYLLEGRDPKVLALDRRLIGDESLFQNLHLVALDAPTGKPRYERQVDTGPAGVMISLVYGSGKIASVASGARAYHARVFDARDGAEAWQTSIPWPTDNHGGHLSRPAIVGDVLMVRPKSFNLHTGAPGKDLAWGGCGSYVCSSEAIFYRSGNITMFAPEQGTVSSWSRLRPDCWISTVPACGMVLSPEGGGGCWCSIWMETSAGFMPAGLPAPRLGPRERSYVGSLQVPLTGSAGGTIRYTLDGGEPGPDSPLYGEPLVITGDRVELKARAFRSGTGSGPAASDVTAAVFTRSYPPPDWDYKPTSFVRSQAIGISKQDPDGVIRYTRDGSDPTPQSRRYEGPVTISETTEIRAATFYPTGRRTDVIAKTFCRAEPIQHGDKELLPGLAFLYAEYWGDKIPDFSTLTVAATGLSDRIDLTPLTRKDGSALRFDGYLVVPEAGDYTFFLRSDDGSRLSLDGATVVDNDGMHDANATRQGKVTLTAGPHALRVEYFELVGGEVLDVGYEGPGVPRQTIPATVLYHETKAAN